MIVELIIQGTGLGNEDFRTDLHFTDYIKGDKGDKGDAFTFEDFTPEQIEVLQQPATEAAEESRKVSNEISDVEEKRATVEQNRVTAEGTRKDNEAKRVTTERTRVESEAGRIDKEKERVSAETSRASAEQNRTLAEERRRQEHTAAVKESGAATTKADSAAEHATEVAAGIDGRMTKAEAEMFQLRTVEMPLKADLESTTKTVPSAQIAPLQGLQTGVDCTDGYFGDRAAIYPQLTLAGDRTIEISFYIDRPINTVQCILTTTDSDNNFRVNTLANGRYAIYCGGNMINTIPVTVGTHHIVISTNYGEKLSKLFFDGALISEFFGANLSKPTFFLIGRYSPTLFPFVDGMINKVRLFNSKLSDADCLSLWNNGDPLNYILPDAAKILTDPILYTGAEWYVADKGTYTAANGVYSAKVHAVTQYYGVRFSWPKFKNDSNYEVTFDVTCNDFSRLTQVAQANSSFNKQTSFFVENADGSRSYTAKLIGWNKQDKAICDISIGTTRLSDKEFSIVISNVKIKNIGCIAEYLPCGLLADKWRDTSGNGNDIAAVGTPQLTYERPQSLNEVVVDTGVFYTNIATGVASKTVAVPIGYCITDILVTNSNTLHLTNLSLKWNYGGTLTLSSDRIYNFGTHMTGNTEVVKVLNCMLPRFNQTPNLVLNATGNTTAGGMRVKLICKWIGL